ncbi:hypothetical protein Adt_11586 [Abeliophyllum distichum]|uniref:Uncharacterized protein n=1 Tax=Abeliophyllum distichum TaxID=126358 RepID=A0ABD1UND2_9LAMI
MNIARGLVLKKELYSILTGFEEKFNKAEDNSNKFTEDLRAMDLRTRVWDPRMRLSGLSAQRWADERFSVAEDTIASVNHDFDTLVTPKDRQQMIEAMIEVVKVKSPSTPEYVCLNALFIEVGGYQLTKRILAIHLDWDLSFLLVEASLSA